MIIKGQNLQTEQDWKIQYFKNQLRGIPEIQGLLRDSFNQCTFVADKEFCLSLITLLVSKNILAMFLCVVLRSFKVLNSGFQI